MGDPSSFTPISRQTITPEGTLVGPVRDASGVAAMPAYDATVPPGALDMPVRSPSQSFTKMIDTVLPRDPEQPVRDTQSRSGSARYGLYNAVGETAVQTAVNAWNGEAVDNRHLAQNLAVNTVFGVAATYAMDIAKPRWGAARAGGAVGAFFQAGASGYSNYRT